MRESPGEVKRMRGPTLGLWRNRTRGVVSLILLGALAAGLIRLARFDERRSAVHEFIRVANGEPTSDGIYIGQVLRTSEAPEFTVIFSRVPLDVNLERSEIRIRTPQRRLTIPGSPLLLVDAEGRIRARGLRLARGHDVLIAKLLDRGTDFDAVRDLYLVLDPDLRHFWEK